MALDYLRDIALAMSSLQRAFLPEHPRQWQYGLEVTMRGISTQAFKVDGGEHRAILDLVRYQVRLGGRSWPLEESDGPALFEQFKLWLANNMIEAKLEEPEFSASAGFDRRVASAYAADLWWVDEQFRQLKAGGSAGVTSPILLYPHHFDLAMSRFPYDDKRQLTIGWSTGDTNVPEPYVYLTAYPEPDNFKQLKLPDEAHWQSVGFSGAVLPYAKLRAAADPAELFGKFGASFKQNPWA